MIFRSKVPKNGGRIFIKGKKWTSYYIELPPFLYNEILISIHATGYIIGTRIIYVPTDKYVFVLGNNKPLDSEHFKWETIQIVRYERYEVFKMFRNSRVLKRRKNAKLQTGI